MESILRDVRYGSRSLLKSPALTGVSILALTLGIGLTTTMFSIVYGALMRGLPFERSDRIMHLERNNLSRGQESLEVPIHDYVDWRAQQRSFEGLAAFYTGTVNISGTEKPERYDGAFITANAFRLLRTRALLGRTFREGEDAPGAEPVIVLGYALWRDRYAGDRNIVGKTVRANGEPMMVVGVMPEKFEFPIRQAVWIPLRMDPLKLKRGEGMTLEVFGRLKDGVTIDQAVLEMNGIAKRLAIEYPDANEGVGAVVKPYTEEYIGEEPRTLLLTMLGAVAFVLLIACANVANLLLGRAAHRSKEVGIRTALGASRRAVIFQFLTEALLLSVSGAVLGIGIAYAGVRLFNASIADSNPPFWIDIRLDPLALLFVLAIALMSSLVAGLLPALQASRVDINEILKDESRGSSSFRIGRLSKVLVVFEIALSCGLLVAAGLMIKSVTRLRHIDLGFTTTDVFTARVGLPEAEYPSDTSQVQFFDELAGRVAALPGVTSAALTTNLPALGPDQRSFAREGVAYAKKQDYPRARRIAVSPSFFATFGARLREGRGIAEQDRKGSLPVAVVNGSFVKKHFGGESPLGRRIRLGEGDSEEPWMTIVGVAPDLHAGEADNKDPEAMYVPFAQQPARFVSVVARTRGAPGELTPLVRDAVAAIDADLPIYFVRSLADAIARTTWFYRVFGTIFMIFGFVALFLASIGLYAVMAFSVARRVREMGVRMALGAQSGHVIRLIFRQGFLQIAIGMAFGLALAAGVSRLLSIVLFEVKPLDPATFASVVLVLSASGLLACLVPALRATRVDPIVALRTE
jgi:putative ABC transport system permease protein